MNPHRIVEEENPSLNPNEVKRSHFCFSVSTGKGMKSKLQKTLFVSIAINVVVIGGVLLWKQTRPERSSREMMPQSPSKPPTTSPVSHSPTTKSATSATAPTITPVTQPATGPSTTTPKANHDAERQRAEAVAKEKRKEEDQKNLADLSAQISAALRDVEKLPADLTVTDKKKTIDEQLWLLKAAMDNIDEVVAKIQSLGDVPATLDDRIKTMKSYRDDLDAMNKLFVWWTKPDKGKKDEYDGELKKRLTAASAAKQRFDDKFGAEKMDRLLWKREYQTAKFLIEKVKDHLKP